MIELPVSLKVSFQKTLCYMDDIVIISSTFEQHSKDLEEVFNRFCNAGLKLLPKKCKFAYDKHIFLGHEISQKDFQPPAYRLQAISNYPLPKSVKALQGFLGLMNWLRNFTPNLSSITACLYPLLKKRCDI